MFINRSGVGKIILHPYIGILSSLKKTEKRETFKMAEE